MNKFLVVREKGLYICTRFERDVRIKIGIERLTQFIEVPAFVGVQDLKQLSWLSYYKFSNEGFDSFCTSNRICTKVEIFRDLRSSWR